MKFEKLYLIMFLLGSFVLSNADYSFHIQASTGSCSVQSSCSDGSFSTKTDCENASSTWSACDSKSECASTCGGSWTVDDVQNLILGFNPLASNDQDELDVLAEAPPSDASFYISMENSIQSSVYYYTNILNATTSNEVRVYFKIIFPEDLELDGQEIELSWDKSVLSTLGDINLEFLDGSKFNMLSESTYPLSSNNTLHQLPFITIKPDIDATISENRPPIAHAGDKIITFGGATINLDGSGSVDPDLDPITYAWTADDGTFVVGDNKFGQYTVPNPNPGVCSDSSFDNLDECLCGASGVYMADSCKVATDLTGNTWNNSTTFDVTLTVSDGSLQGSDVVQVEVLRNEAPKSVITTFLSEEIVVTPASTVTTVENQLINGRDYVLDGSGSYDNTNVGELSFSWSVSPSGIVLSDNSSSSPNFTAPLLELETNFTATLTVTDAGNESHSSSLAFTVLANQKPTAYIADILYPDIVTEEDDTLTNIIDYRLDEYDLDGSLSSDINTGDTIIYRWVSPSEAIVISADSIAAPSFTVSSEAVGDHALQLYVNDGTIDSDPFTLNVTVRANQPPIINKVFLRDTVDVDMEDKYVELPDLQVYEGRFFKLNVGSSIDANQDNLAFSWQPYLCNEYSLESECLASTASCTWSSGKCGYEGLRFVDGYLSSDSLVAFIAEDNILGGSIEIDVKVSEIGGSNVTTESISVSVQGNFKPYAKVTNVKAVEGSEILLLSSGSFDVNMDALTYEWSAHESNPNVLNFLSATNIANPVFSIPKTGEDAIYKFVLKVKDPESLESSDETLTVEVFKDGPSAPESPKLDVTSSQGVVVLNWDSDPSENSLDSFTSYSDFEGYRIYRSDDGGETWGDIDDIIKDGLVDIAWPSIKQYDLDQLDDSLHCVEKFAFESETVDCESIRGTSFSGADPLTPWINIGINSGLEYTYVDSSIVDGVEYLYSITAYDTGIQGYSMGHRLLEGYDYYIDSLSWPSSNPDNFYGPQGGVFADYDACMGSGNECFASFPSLESNKGYFADMFSEWNSSIPYSLDNGVIHNDSLWYATQSISKGQKPSLEYTSLWQFISPAYSVWSSSVDYDNVGVDYDVVSRNNVLYRYDNSGSILGQAPETSSKWVKMFPNLVSIIPGTSATNVINFGFAGEQAADSIFISEKADTDVVGNGGSYFRFINEDDLSDKLYLIEIDAEYTSEDGTEYDLFENYASFSPEIFIYEIKDTVSYEIADEAIYNVSDLPSGSIQDSLSLPGARYTDPEAQSTISIPNYIIRDFPIKYLLESGYKNSWTDSFDGIRLNFLNNVKDLNLLNNKRVIMKNRKAFNSDSLKYENNGIYFLRDWGVSVDLSYSDMFYSRPSYSYKIEFFEDNTERAVWNNTSSCHDDCQLISSESECNAAEDLGCGWNDEQSGSGSKCFFMTPIPFRVTNLTTDRNVGVYLTDNGVNGTREEGDGAGDCVWERSESIAFKLDTTNIRLKTDGSVVNRSNYTFDLSVDYKLSIVGGGAIEQWDSTKIYQKGELAIYHKSAWESKDVILSAQDNPSVLRPSEFGSKWKPVHPWEDGDFVIVEPLSWFADGDSWVADLSLLGRPRGVTQNDLEKVRAVPNPYLINSIYNESLGDYKMWFTNLPRECKLSIWTVSGDLVKTIYHNDNYDGKKQWNLRNDSGNLVAPGLYLYVVDSGDFKHAGKFAVVR